MLPHILIFVLCNCVPKLFNCLGALIEGMRRHDRHGMVGSMRDRKTGDLRTNKIGDDTA